MSVPGGVRELTRRAHTPVFVLETAPVRHLADLKHSPGSVPFGTPPSLSTPPSLHPSLSPSPSPSSPHLPPLLRSPLASPLLPHSRSPRRPALNDRAAPISWHFGRRNQQPPPPPHHSPGFAAPSSSITWKYKTVSLPSSRTSQTQGRSGVSSILHMHGKCSPHHPTTPSSLHSSIPVLTWSSCCFSYAKCRQA